VRYAPIDLVLYYNLLIDNYRLHGYNIGMKRPKLKEPSDYPQMAFRVSTKDKERLTELIDEVHRIANTKISSGDRRFKKNEIIVDALWLGLTKFIKSKYQ